MLILDNNDLYLIDMAEVLWADLLNSVGGPDYRHRALQILSGTALLAREEMSHEEYYSAVSDSSHTFLKLLAPLSES